MRCQLGSQLVQIDIETDFAKGRRQNSLQLDDKNMLGNIGDLFVKCVQQVTKSHLHHLLGVSDYYVIMYICTGTGSFVKRRQRSPNGLLNPLDGSVTFCERFVVRGSEF